MPALMSKKQLAGEVIVGPFYGKWTVWSSLTMELATLILHQRHLFQVKSVKIWLTISTESEQTPSAVGLNVPLDEKDKVKVAGGFYATSPSRGF